METTTQTAVKIEELRVGNWIYLMHGSFGYKPHQVSPTLLFHNAKVTERLTFSKPIPLTPEILVKCGFELDEGRYLKPVGSNISIAFRDDIYLTYDSDCASFDEELGKYLHQLQNLYFALTGEELTINL
jgi:hypothetical protein